MLKARKQKHIFRTCLAAALISAAIPACAYRFTNNYIRTPAQARTIAIESIFDTSREVLPHEVLWESLQRAFAKDGHLILAPRNEADLLLRVHIREANIAPAGSAERVGPLIDPKPVNGAIPNFDEFRILPRAGFFSQAEAISASIDAEVYDLRNRNLVMQKAYTTGASFKSIRERHLFAANSSYLFYEESVRATFKRMSEDIASRIITDLLVQ